MTRAANRPLNRRGVVLLLLALAIFRSGPATASHEGNHPTFRTQHAYLTCSYSDGGYVWRAEQPGSALHGNGCQAVQPVEPYVAATACTAARICWPNRSWVLTFRGEFTGNLRDLALRMHRLTPTEQSEPFGAVPNVSLWVDGTWIPLEEAGSAPTPAGTSDTYQLSIARLGCARQVLDEEGGVTDVMVDGLATEDGPGSHLHDIQISVWGPQFWSPPWEPSVWVWGASEFPSSIRANPEAELIGDVRVPQTPADCT